MRLPEPHSLLAAIVGEDPLMRSGLRALLETPATALQIVELLHPEDLPLAALGHVEVLLWDLGIHPPPRTLFPDAPPTVVLVPDAEGALDALREGALGALARDASPARIWAGLLAATEGLVVLDPRFLPLAPQAPGGRSARPEALSPRELEVLTLLAEGRSNREIGVALGISTHTAKFHVNAILAKLDAATRTEAVVQAVRLGLLTL